MGMFGGGGGFNPMSAVASLPGVGSAVGAGMGAAGQIPGVGAGMGMAGLGGGMMSPGGMGSIASNINATGGVAPGGATPEGGPAVPGAEGFDINSFVTDNPQYKFLQGEGIRGLERSAAAKGGFGGGGLMKDLVSFSSGLASQSYGSEMDRIMKMAGVEAGSPAAAGQVYGQQAQAGTDYGLGGNMSLGGLFSLFQ